jgi:hypothetical protein
MATWTKELQGTDVWRLEYLVLYLLTESNENLLDETGDLILLNQGGVGIHTKLTHPSKTWTDESSPVSGWIKESEPTSIWT